MSIESELKLSDSEVTLSERPRACHRVSIHVQVLWATLSLVVTVGCSFSFIQPHWFVQRQTRDCLGLYNYCLRDPRAALPVTRQFGALIGALSAPPRQICGVYGGEFDLSKLPSNVWQIACVLYGGGCVLLACGSLTAVVTLCLPRIWSYRLSCYTGYIQTMAAVILISSVIIFPVGLESPLAQRFCPGARMYHGGECHAGWAYILGVMSAALSVFCPFLSQYTDFNDDLITKLIP